MKGWVKFQVAETIAFRLERELFEYRNKDIDSVTIQCTEEVKGSFCGEQTCTFEKAGRNSWVFHLFQCG